MKWGGSIRILFTFTLPLITIHNRTILHQDKNHPSLFSYRFSLLYFDFRGAVHFISIQFVADEFIFFRSQCRKLLMILLINFLNLLFVTVGYPFIFIISLNSSVVSVFFFALLNMHYLIQNFEKKNHLDACLSYDDKNFKLTFHLLCYFEYWTMSPLILIHIS